MKYRRFDSQLIGRDNADPAEQRENDGKLERHSEGKDQPHHQRQVLTDLGQQRDLRLPRRPSCCMPSEKRTSIGMTMK